MTKYISFLCGLVALLLAGPAGSSAAQAEETAVRIGVLTDMGGTYSDLSGKGSVIAAQMAIEDFGGKALGKPISLVSADHQQKSDVATGIARRWFDTENVDMIVDLPLSAVALAVQGLARDKNKITMITTAAPELATGAQCSPTGVHWVYDTYSAGKTLALALTTQPGDKWFFIVSDNVTGEYLRKATERFLTPLGAVVVGGVRHPLNTSDMSSYLLTAKSSGAKYIALGNAGGDLITLLKQAKEFGIGADGQKMVAIVTFLTDIKSIGLDRADGMVFATGFFPDQSDEARAWSKRFLERHGAMPNDSQAGVYSAVTHYLKAVQAVGSKDTSAVMAKMRELPINDMFAKNGHLREDGRMVHDTFLVQAKSPDESKGTWDLLKLVKTIPGDQAFRPLSESDCPLVKKAQ
jgi:branched-chain amino acid transport system substrate-binding protein